MLEINDLLWREADPAQLRAIHEKATGETPPERLGLLMDLLQHVIVELTLLAVAPALIDGHRLPRVDRCTADDLPGVSPHQGDVPILEVDNLTGVLGKRRRIGGDPALPLPNSDDDG